MEDKQLQHPLLPIASPSAAATASGGGTTTGTHVVGPTSNANFSIALRLLFVLVIVFISAWANHEASKGFVITVNNNMRNTPVGNKFFLFYVSNDEATRLVQYSYAFAAKILSPDDHSIMPERLIDQVDIQLASHNLSHDHTVGIESCGQVNKYVLSISPLVMEYGDFKFRIRKEIQQGMAEILLLNQQNGAPRTLLDGVVEYISNLAGFGGRKPVFELRSSSGKCWEDEDPKVVAVFLGYAEGKSEGFVGRLNQEMSRDGWYEGIVDKALGMPAIHLCESFRYSMGKNEDLISTDRISTYR